MTELEVMNDLMFCYNADCKNCTRLHGGENCTKKLMKDACSVIKMQVNAIRDFDEKLDRLEKENAELTKKASVRYSDQQLTESVNDIIDSFLRYDEYDDAMAAQLRSVGSFMRLARLNGHIAVNPNADRIEIRLDERL